MALEIVRVLTWIEIFLTVCRFVFLSFKVSSFEDQGANGPGVHREQSDGLWPRLVSAQPLHFLQRRVWQVRGLTCLLPWLWVLAYTTAARTHLPGSLLKLTWLRHITEYSIKLYCVPVGVTLAYILKHSPPPALCLVCSPTVGLHSSERTHARTHTHQEEEAEFTPPPLSSTWQRNLLLFAVIRSLLQRHSEGEI